MGELLHQLGLLNTLRVHEVPAHQLIGDHVGATERQLRDALRRAQDGVLFIDEAHQLAEPAGQNALRVLVPELLAIALGEFARQNYRLDATAETALAAHLRAWDAQRGQRGFGNARAARNLVDAIIARQAGHLRPQIDRASDEELNRILAEDILTYSSIEKYHDE
jgi:hypothetical protein